MSTRPFAYNPAGNILGTEQVGSLSVGIPTNGFESTSLKFWNGPDENLGYIIAQPDPQGSHTGADGVPAFLGFIRSSVKTEAAFIELVNTSFDQNFTTGDTAKAWLNTNGYWTSWGTESGVPLSGAFAYNLVTLPYQPPTAGNIIFPNFSNQSGPTNEGLLNPNTFVNNAVWWNKVDSTSTDRSAAFNTLVGQTVTISFTQDGNTAIYSTNGLNLQGECFNISPNQGFTTTLVQASPVNFVAGQLVTISYAIN